MSGRKLFLAAAAAGLAARLTHAAFIQGHPFWDLASIWTNSDMHQYLAWAGRLAAGDWLDVDTFRPYFDYQRAIAPPEVWNAWFGQHVYYQPPLYPYLLALALKTAGGTGLFRVAQLALGAVNCGLAALLGARLFGARAGLLAGLACAGYAPFVMYDAEILRGTVVMTTQLMLLLALAGMPGGGGGARRTRATAAGGAFGLAYLAEPSILLFLPLALGWMAWVIRMDAAPRPVEGPGRRASPPAAGAAARVAAAAAACGLFLTGAAAALSPLIARNAAVGAPLLSSTTRGPIGFVMGNAPDTHPAGAMVPPSTGLILSRSGYGMLSTMRETLRLYQGSYGPLLRKQWEKLVSVWSAYELPDNPSFYYAARVSPVVRWGLRFLPVAALGLAGLVLALAAARQSPAAALLPLFLLATHGLFVLAHVNSRYRQPIALALILLAGHAAVTAWRDRGRAAATVAGVALAALVVLPKGPPEGYGYDRPAEYVLAARLYQDRGAPAEAVAEMTAAIDAARREPPYRGMLPTLLYERGTMQIRAGRRGEAAASFREALAEDPGFAEAREALVELER